MLFNIKITNHKTDKMGQFFKISEEYRELMREVANPVENYNAIIDEAIDLIKSSFKFLDVMGLDEDEISEYFRKNDLKNEKRGYYK